MRRPEGRALRKALHPQGPGPKLARGWGAARSRSMGCGTGTAEIRPTEPGRACPAKGVRYHGEGTIVVALTRADAEQLRFSYEFQRSLGLEIVWLSGVEVRRREPHLRPGISGAVLSPKDHQVDNRLLGSALAEAAQRAGAVLNEHCPVREVDLSGGRARGVVTDRGRDPADLVILAAGAWSREIGGVP